MLGLALFGIAPRGWTQDGTVAAWGDNRFGQGIVPYGMRDIVAIAAGEWHNLALRADGRVFAWGSGVTVPSDLGTVVAIGTGGYHNMAVRADGTIRAWGKNDYGQINVPAGLSNVVAVKGGWVHSLALKADGTVASWGRHTEGQTNIPAGLSNVVAISAGEYHNMALKADGTITAWGNNRFGQTTIPASLSNNVVAIAGGGLHNLALKSDGTVVSWGWNDFGQTNVPAGLSNVVAIAGGAEHSLAVKADGTVVGWGANDGWAFNDPNCEIPGAPCERKYTGQITPPGGLGNVVAIAGGVFHSIALRALQPPSTPALSVGVVDDSSVTLTWSDLPNEAGYRLEARTATGDWVEITSRSANVTKYKHSGLPSGTTMFYRLRAFNGGGTSPYSAEVTAATTGTPVPATPALRLVGATHNQAALQWDDLLNETGYTLERKVGAAEWTVINLPGAGVTSFTDSGVNASSTYLYRIRAFNEAGSSPYSPELTVTTQAPPLQPPVAPALQAQALSHAQVTLSWTAVENATGFTLQRGDGTTDSWVIITNPASDASNYTDMQVSPSTTYAYRIAATNAAGSSAYSAEVNVTTTAVPVLPPVAPSLQATAISPTEALLEWSAVTNEVTYIIERRLDTATASTTVTNLGTDVTSFTDSGLAPETTYIFRIRATNSGGESEWTEASVSTPAVPPNDNPLTFHVLGAEPNGVRVRINGDSGQSFKVQRTLDFQSWTDVTTSTLQSASTEMTLPGDGSQSFFRTVLSE